MIRKFAERVAADRRSLAASVFDRLATDKMSVVHGENGCRPESADRGERHLCTNEQAVSLHSKIRTRFPTVARNLALPRRSDRRCALPDIWARQCHSCLAPIAVAVLGPAPTLRAQWLIAGCFKRISEISLIFRLLTDDRQRSGESWPDVLRSFLRTHGAAFLASHRAPHRRIAIAFRCGIVRWIRARRVQRAGVFLPGAQCRVHGRRFVPHRSG